MCKIIRKGRLKIMDEMLISKIEKELNDAVYTTIREFSDLKINVEVKLVGNIEINAGVGKIREKNKTYRIEINTGVIDTLRSSLVDKYMRNVEEDDFLYYQFAEDGALFRYFDDSSLKNSFMNCMAKFIEYNILFHECAHILLGHSDTGGKNIIEKNTAIDGKKGYGHQAREFMADWYGIKKAMTVFTFSFAKCSKFSLYNNEDLLLFRKIFVVCFLALFCQFDIFEETQIYKEMSAKTNKDKTGIFLDEFSESKLKMRTHPHPYVRLNYGLDALKEAMMDVMQIHNSVDSDTSENIVNKLLEVSLGDVFVFLKKWD